MSEIVLPKSLEKEMHPLCDRELAFRILYELRSNPAVCIQEVAKSAVCSNLTAHKHLIRIVRAGLAIEKRIGRTRIFIAGTPMEGARDGTSQQNSSA